MTTACKGRENVCKGNCPGKDVRGGIGEITGSSVVNKDFGTRTRTSVMNSASLNFGIVIINII